MTTMKQLSESATISVENIGGITETSVTVAPGVTVLSGRNATNRTSFLQAIKAVMGSDDVSLKADADTGQVRLRLNGETYTRKLTRRQGTVLTDGEPFLDDPIAADLFAFLLESNECRQAIIQGDDLRELIMRPVDTDALTQEINELTRKRDEIDSQLDELTSLEGQLPELETRRQELTQAIETKREQLHEKRDALEHATRDIETIRAENEELDEKLRTLETTRSQLESTRRKINTEQDSIAALKQEYAEQQAALDEVPSVDEEELSRIDERLQQKRSQVDSLNQTITEIQSLIQFNEQAINEDTTDVVDQLRAEADPDNPTEQLVDETVVCWTCGSTVSSEQIESTVEALRSLRQEKITTRNSLEQDLDTLQSEQSTLEQHKQQRQQLSRQLSDTEAELESRQQRLTNLRERRAELEDTIETLEDDVDSLQADVDEELLTHQEEINRLEFDIETLESDRAEIDEEIASIEQQLARREQLTAQRKELTTKITDLRTRVEQLQNEAIDAFNTHMVELLEILDYQNLERVWIERQQASVQEGRQVVEKDAFELHIIRSTEDGAVYEDTVDHLSESEREVVGLVFALAGYLAHEVYETVPVMLLDSLEAIDADRLADLIAYFSEYTTYLIVALLIEDANAIPDSVVDTRITEI